MSGSSSRRTRRRPARSSQSRSQGQSSRRVAGRSKEMIDFAGDYASIRHDLKRIAIWCVLLFALMFAGYFFV